MGMDCKAQRVLFKLRLAPGNPIVKGHCWVSAESLWVLGTA